MDRQRSPNTRATETDTITVSQLNQKIKNLTKGKKVISFDNSTGYFYGQLTVKYQNGDFMLTERKESLK